MIFILIHPIHFRVSYMTHDVIICAHARGEWLLSALRPQGRKFE